MSGQSPYIIQTGAILTWGFLMWAKLSFIECHFQCDKSLDILGLSQRATWSSTPCKTDVKGGQKVQSYLQQKTCSSNVGWDILCSQASPPTADISAPFLLRETWVSGREVTRPFAFAAVMLFWALGFDLTSHLFLLKYCHSVWSDIYYPECPNNIGSDLLLKTCHHFMWLLLWEAGGLLDASCTWRLTSSFT